MSLPWEPDNLESNLTTLSILRRGELLSVLKEGENTDQGTYGRGNNRGLRARFKIEGKMRQSFVRSKKGESVLEDDQYLIPLTRVFQEAVKAWQSQRITGDKVRAAVRGLNVLRKTYSYDTTRRDKMTEIIQIVDREVRGVHVEGVFFEPGERLMVLGSQAFPAMRQRILQIITEGNERLDEEYTAGVTQDFIEAIYGKNAPRQNPTKLPVGNTQNYRRKSMGVCQQFHRDAHQGPGVKLDGERITCSQEHLQRLYQFTNSDEGLLFATSQVASQACVGGVANIILTSGGRDGQTPVPLIQIGPERVFPNFPPTGQYQNITKDGNQVVVSASRQFTGNDLGFGTAEPKPLIDFGISHISFVVSVRLKRVGNRIELNLSDSTLRITTSQLPE